MAAILEVLDRTTLPDLVAPRRRLAAKLGIVPAPRPRRAAGALAS
jgi:hypothetical protein